MATYDTYHAARQRMGYISMYEQRRCHGGPGLQGAYSDDLVLHESQGRSLGLFYMNTIVLSFLFVE